jgi:hypothetical protein
MTLAKKRHLVSVALVLLVPALLLGQARTARADVSSVLPVPQAAGPAGADLRGGGEYEKARRNRDIGIILTAVGGAAILTGVSLFIVGAKRPGSDAEGGGLQYYFPGGLILGAGTLVALPGAIMWPINQRKMDRLKPTLSAAPAGSMGGGLSWSF